MLAILVRKSFVAGGRRSPVTFLRLLHQEPISKPFPTSPSSPKSDVAASFFKTSCGLSPSAALTAAAKINIKTTANAESVIRLLGSYGFTKSDVAVMASKFPGLFSYDAEKRIKPKLDLFVAAGFTGNLITKIFSKSPRIFKYSVERKISPNLNLLMTILGGDRKAVATSFADSPWIASLDLKKHMLSNMGTLREHGVAGDNIARLFTWCPRAITKEPGQFSKSLALIEEMGFDPANRLFIHGIKVLSRLSPSAWERKLQVYRSLGWSQEETLSAFKRSPMCMLISEEKVRKVVAFFAENLKWEPSRLALLPMVLNFSFEKRIVPRYAVFKILSASGLSRKKLSFSTLLITSESDFLKKYVCKYSDIVPELLEAYKVKLDTAVAVPSNLVL